MDRPHPELFVGRVSAGAPVRAQCPGPAEQRQRRSRGWDWRRVRPRPWAAAGQEPRLRLGRALVEDRVALKQARDEPG